MQTEGTGWQAPKQFDRRVVIYPAVLVALVAVTALITAVVVRATAPPPAAPLAPPAERELTPLEAVAVNALLDRQRGGAVKATLTIGVEGRSITAQLTYTGDMAAGSGTVSAGGTRGEALLDQGVVYLRGNQDFWTALGVGGAAPAAPGWAVLPPEFFEGKLFYPPAAWTAALAPTPEARINGGKYTVVKSWAHINGTSTADNAAQTLPKGATLAPMGQKVWIDHYAVPGVEADLVPADPAVVAAAAAPLNTDRGPGAPLVRDPKGSWAFGEAPEPAGHR